jgi:hypothetical protein
MDVNGSHTVANNGRQESYEEKKRRLRLQYYSEEFNKEELLILKQAGDMAESMNKSKNEILRMLKRDDLIDRISKVEKRINKELGKSQNSKSQTRKAPASKSQKTKSQTSSKPAASQRQVSVKKVKSKAAKMNMFSTGTPISGLHKHKAEQRFKKLRQARFTQKRSLMGMNINLPPQESNRDKRARERAEKKLKDAQKALQQAVSNKQEQEAQQQINEAQDELAELLGKMRVNK